MKYFIEEWENLYCVYRQRQYDQIIQASFEDKEKAEEWIENASKPKKVTIEQLNIIYHGSDFMEYEKTEIEGVTALQNICGSEVCEVDYYAITDEKAFAGLCEKVANYDNVERLLNNYLVELVESERGLL